MGWFGTKQSIIWDKNLRMISIKEVKLAEIQKMMSQQTKTLTEVEREKLCWESMEILINKIKELNFGDMIAEMLELEDGNFQSVDEIHNESQWRVNMDKEKADLRPNELLIEWIFVWPDN